MFCASNCSGSELQFSKRLKFPFIFNSTKLNRYCYVNHFFRSKQSDLQHMYKICKIIRQYASCLGLIDKRMHPHYFLMKIFALLTLFIKFDRHGKMFIASKSRVSKTCHIHIHLLYCLGNNFYLTKPFFHTEKCYA